MFSNKNQRGAVLQLFVENIAGPHGQTLGTSAGTLTPRTDHFSSREPQAGSPSPR